MEQKMGTIAQREKAKEVREYYQDMSDTELIATIAAENEKLEKELEKADEELDQAEKRQQTLTKTIEGLEKENEILAKEISGAKLAIQRLTRERDELKSINGKYASMHLNPRDGMKIPKPKLSPIILPEYPEEIVKIRKDATISCITIVFKDEETR